MSTTEDIKRFVSDQNVITKEHIINCFIEKFKAANDNDFKFAEPEMGGWECWDKIYFVSMLPLKVKDTYELISGIALCKDSDHDNFGEIHLVIHEEMELEQNKNIKEYSVEQMIEVFDELESILDTRE